MQKIYLLFPSLYHYLYLHISLYICIYLSVSISVSIYLSLCIYLSVYLSKLQNKTFINIHRNKSKETKKIYEMWNKCNLMKKNQIYLKIMFSFSRLVKFSFTSFLNKGRVQKLSIVTGRNVFQRNGAWDEIADLKKPFGY